MPTKKKKSKFVTAERTQFENQIQKLLKSKFSLVEKNYKVDWKNLFDRPTRVDYYCEDKNGNPLCIEVTWQASEGTADKKVVYFITQIKKCHKIPTILVIGGDGWGKGIKEWAIAQKKSKMFFGCYSTAEFFKILNTQSLFDDINQAIA